MKYCNEGGKAHRWGNVQLNKSSLSLTWYCLDCGDTATKWVKDPSPYKR